MSINEHPYSTLKKINIPQWDCCTLLFRFIVQINDNQSTYDNK